ncbi:Alpha-1,3-glucosyltransferase [Mycena kentingensis (nom. inval.)]|nr:Alpha-1,3-glucosyltransferase [Mycena kentingensis (nom. inval.)]
MPRARLKNMSFASCALSSLDWLFSRTGSVPRGSVCGGLCWRDLVAHCQVANMSKTATAPVAPKAKAWFNWDIATSEYDLLVLSTAFKLLLFPAYRSTDFEVHRNWLAITHSLPISKWYYDTTSEWTLDYPPFFAYFEKILSIPASFIDPKIVDLNNLNYDAWSVVAYQRTTVILSELVLGAVLLKFIRGSVDPSTQRIISASLFLHPGFLIVDHIHFQYNGFMFGILLWSILMARNGRKLASGILFAVLLNFKHIYMYLAPAYFIYLLRSYCFSPSSNLEIKHFLSLANSVIAVFILSFGPFIVMGQIPQVLSRLFPFTRGLNHAYWAPNAWALVTAADRVLLRYVTRTGAEIVVNASGVASTSRGLVGDTVFAVLPNIKPIHTFAITVLFQSVALVKLWFNPSYKSFVTALTLCGYASYLFGWHVHEKAILLVLVPLSLLAAERHAYFRTFILASVAGIFSLFPLIFTAGESMIKVVYSVLWIIFVYVPLTRRVYEYVLAVQIDLTYKTSGRYPKSFSFVIIDTLEKVYLAGFPFLQLFVTVFPFAMARRANISPSVCVPTEEFTCAEPELRPPSAMEFLPLMLTKVPHRSPPLLQTSSRPRPPLYRPLRPPTLPDAMCHGPNWKREAVPDHKFDFISVADFRDNGFKMRAKYFFLFLVFFKSFAVYMSDIFTAVTMLSTDNWSNQIFSECTAQTKNGCVPIPFETGKWLFVGCIIFSFLLLAYESRKAKLIVASHDISYAFTNVLANNYYSLRSYDHFCFFDHISNSTKTSDDFAFFVFFVFKSWKRVLLADGPRQSINALTLYSVWLAKHDKAGWNIPDYFKGNTTSTSILTVTTLFTVVVFAGSLLLLIVAGICYIPLLSSLTPAQEYCCHKVDKRIESVIKKHQKKRLEENRKQAMKEARGDFSHLKNKKGEFTSKPLPQPTLPNLSVDDDYDDTSSLHTRVVAPSTYTQDSYYYNDKKNYNPPPMPAYNPYSAHQGSDAYATFNPSQPTFQGADEYPAPYEDDSDVHLTSGAAPFSHAGQYAPDRTGSPYYAAPDRTASPYYAAPDRTNSPYYAAPDRTGTPSNNYNNQQYSQQQQYPQSQHPIDRPGSAAPYPQGNYDPHDVYSGRAGPPPNSRSPHPQQRPSPGPEAPQNLTYSDADAYGGYNQQHQRPQYGGYDAERGGAY